MEANKKTLTTFTIRLEEERHRLHLDTYGYRNRSQYIRDLIDRDIELHKKS